VEAIIQNAYKQARDLIGSHMDVLHKSAALLLEKEKISGSEFEALFEA
jgi:cell division protease FtsH